MSGNEPPYLTVGTDVSAKYKGAFCEAKVKKVNRSVKVKVILKECHSSIIVTDENIKGHLSIGSNVEVKQPSNGQFADAVINKLTDSSMYTVVFDDGDEATLRRSQLCLKGDKHFTESETLDNLPLSHPEHFGTPVLQKKTKKTVNAGIETESEEGSNSDNSIPKRQTYRGRQQELVGKVMLFESTERRKGGSLIIPVLIVMPDAHDTDLRTKDHLLVKSFKDSKYTSVLKKELKEFNRDVAVKNETPALKNAMEKALSYFENRELPSSWKREELLGSDDENDEDESSDDEQNEEKDRFVAQLYKFMDDRGTPINKVPSVGVHDLNLYRLFKVVQNLGGYNKVTNLDKWRLVYNKMGLPSSNLASSQMKNAYKKFLHAFEDFYRKLGSTMGTLSRPGRQRNNSGRNIIPFRGRDKETNSSPRVKKAEKEMDDSSSDKSKTAKSADDTSDTDSLLKDESDNDTIKRSVTRRDREKHKEENKDQKPETREKRESMRCKTEEKKAEEEKRITRRDKDDGSLKDEKVTPKKEEKSEEKNKDEAKEDSSKKRVSRRKSGRGGEDSKKDDEEEEVDDKDQKKKSKTDKEEKKVEEKKTEEKKIEEKKVEEKKVEEKKLTRKDMKEKKMNKEEKIIVKEDKVIVKEDKVIVKEVIVKEDKVMKEDKIIVKEDTVVVKEDTVVVKEDTVVVKEEKIVKEENRDDDKTPIIDQQEDSGDEEDEEEHYIQEDDDKRKELPYGTKVKVKYGRGKNIKLYEAKVVEASKDGSQKTYLVHYAGWNNRYDEWIKRERVVCIMERPESAKKAQKKTMGSVSPKYTLKQQLVSQIQKKRGRPNAGTPPPTKSSEFRIPQTRSPVLIPTIQSIIRPTRSNSLEMKGTDSLPAKTRKSRKSPGITDSSRASDESSDSDEDMDTDEKIPDLSETGSLSKTPDRDDPESEQETSMEEEAPELEVMKPFDEIPPKELENNEDKEKELPMPTPEPVLEKPVLEPIVDRTLKDNNKDKQIKDTKDKAPRDTKDKTSKDMKDKTAKDIKDKTPKDIKDKTPKDTKDKTSKEVKDKSPKEVKDKTPKEVKEKPKEVIKLKEVKDKAKEMKEKAKEVKEKPKEVKEKVKDVRRLLLSDAKTAEVKSVSIYDFEDTEIADDFKIEERKFDTTEFTDDFDIDEIVKSVLMPDLANGDRMEEIKVELERGKVENDKKKHDLAKQSDEFEEMIKNDAKLDLKDVEDGEKKMKMKKKDLKDSTKKEIKCCKRGRPPADKQQHSDVVYSPKQPDFSPVSSTAVSFVTKTIADTPTDESSEIKLKRETLDSKTKKKEILDKSPTTVEDNKMSDNEAKETNENLEKKKVKKKVKKKIFGENLNDSSEPLAFSDLTKEHIDKLKPEMKKEVKTPKSACKDKLLKSKEVKKTKESDLAKELLPLMTCAINSEIPTISDTIETVKRIRSRSVSPEDNKVAKVVKLDNSEHKIEPMCVLQVTNVIPTSSREMKVTESSSDSTVQCVSVPENESKTSVVATLLDITTPPRTPEHQKNTNIVSVPSASKQFSIKTKEDNFLVSVDQTSNSGSESPIPVGVSPSVTSLEGTEGSIQHSSENSNDVECHNIKRKRESEDPTPTKKQKRRTSTKMNKTAEKNKSKFNGSDSEDTNSSKFPSPNHTPGSPHKHSDSLVRPPRSPKYNFHIEESNFLLGEQKILFITDRMKEIRKLYLTIKAEVTSIDKRRKRARRKERDNSQSSHVDNDSS